MEAYVSRMTHAARGGCQSLFVKGDGLACPYNPLAMSHHRVSQQGPPSNEFDIVS